MTMLNKIKNKLEKETAGHIDVRGQLDYVNARVNELQQIVSVTQQTETRSQLNLTRNIIW